MTEEGPKCTTVYGEVEGFFYKVKEENVAKIFLGVPYAKPPVGELRFRVCFI